MDSNPKAPTRARRKVANGSKSTKWSAEEDDILLSLLKDKEYPINWSELTTYLQGKSPQQISERWEKVINPNLIKGSWTQEEDEAIINYVKLNGTRNWTKLAATLPGRIGKQCRERWRNHLDPSVNRNPWTPEEDELLISLHNEYGNSWVKIAELIAGRSDNCVKNRWNSTIKKRIMYQETGTPPPRRGRPPKSSDDVPKPPKIDEIIAEEKKSASQHPTPLLSPFTSLKSPGLNFDSPIHLEWSPEKDSEGIMSYSSQMFSPSVQENRGELLQLLSPVFKK